MDIIGRLSEDKEKKRKKIPIEMVEQGWVRVRKREQEIIFTTNVL